VWGQFPDTTTPVGRGRRALSSNFYFVAAFSFAVRRHYRATSAGAHAMPNGMVRCFVIATGSAKARSSSRAIAL